MEKDLALYHHGIKGQKWGVRRTPIELGHRPKATINRNMRKKGREDYARARIMTTGSRREAVRSENKRRNEMLIKKGIGFISNQALSAGISTIAATAGTPGLPIAIGAAYIRKAVNVGLGVSAVTNTVRSHKNKKAIKKVN